MKHKLIARFEEPTTPWKVNKAVDLQYVFRVKEKEFGFWFDSEEDRNMAKVELERIGATCELVEPVVESEVLIEEEEEDAIIT